MMSEKECKDALFQRLAQLVRVSRSRAEVTQ